MNTEVTAEFTALAARVVAALDGRSLAVAESLTAGMVSAAIGSVAGVSQIYRGAIICYATDVKTQLLGVDEETLAVHTPVSVPVATQMVKGVASLLDARAAIATTGVAGPGEAWGKPAGSVVIAALVDDHLQTRELQLAGTRDEVRAETTVQALALLATLGEQNRA